uniref:HNH endonuclease n=1 Tax=Nocardioides sp. TaxID=35761 RepID=UPI002B27771E
CSGIRCLPSRLVRPLEHRADGSLVHKVIVESAPRRSGKSVRLRGLALWRMEHSSLFGEVQTVMHTGSDVAICREIQRAAWRWAEDVADWTVSRANGKEAIESTTGDRWLVRAQSAVYGYDVCLGLVDEGWDVTPGTVTEGLEPATLERSSPQLHLTSTAHRRATSLMRNRISAALAADDGETLLLVWAAPAGSDIADPEVWRAASPHWTEDRRKMIAAKYAAAMAGTIDAEADEPDPVAGFCAQYLNQWRLSGRVVVRGNELVSAEAWHARALLPDDQAKPAGAAIESWFGRGTSLALAYREGERTVVSVSDHDDLAAAAAAVKATGYRGRVTVGKSLMSDPALSSLNRQASTQMMTAAVADFARLLTEDALHHDGGEHLSAQVLEVRTQPGADGARMVSKGRADAIKAAVWAASAARVDRSRLTQIVLPSGVGS